MSTIIYRKNLPRSRDSAWGADLSITRFASGKNETNKCGYQMAIGGEYVTLTAEQMKEFVQDLNTFFYAEGYL